MKSGFLLVLCFVCLPAAHALSAATAGSILKTEGKVYHYQADSPRPRQVRALPAGVDFGDQVQTRRDSAAHLRFVNGSKVVLEELSSLVLRDQGDWQVDDGTVLFDIQKSGKAKGLTVTSAAVTIGVKGTRFAVVRVEDATAIFLNKGTLNLKSKTPEAMFRLQGELQEGYEDTLKAMQDRFNATRDAMSDRHAQRSLEMQEMFESNRQKMKQGKLQEVAEFDLQAGMAVVIQGQDLFTLEIPVEWEARFKVLDDF